jgi:glycosyltransferase involved in cell wall biosynthesis
MNNCPAKRLAVVSCEGNPRDPGVWSGTPKRIASTLEAFGVAVEAISAAPPAITKLKYRLAARLAGVWDFKRTRVCLDWIAQQVTEEVQSRALADVLHMGTITAPAVPRNHARHFIYLDSTFHLLAAEDPRNSPPRYAEQFDMRERAALESAEHIFAISDYVMADIVGHYRIPARRVTVAGTGYGPVRAYSGPKDYTSGTILFVARQRFEQKGGRLLLEAFRQVANRNPALKLVMVCEERYRPLIQSVPNAILKTNLSWPDLERLFMEAVLFAMPAFAEPWGLVYLEALACRCPILGLRRKALPQITQNGRFGFLVAEPSPEAVADAIFDAFSDPLRLQKMGQEGQQHVLENYTWEATTQKLLAGIYPARYGEPLNES